jgi:hypothetical protein
MTETYVVACPAELFKCQNRKTVIHGRLVKYAKDISGYHVQNGSIHFPCAPLAFDANTEEQFLLRIHDYPIFSGIPPKFLVHKFSKVFSSAVLQKLERRWIQFLKVKGKGDPSTRGGSTRSSEAIAYHFGIWRRRQKLPFVTSDSRPDNTRKQGKLNNFLRVIGKHLAPRLRTFIKNYAPAEWEIREKCAYLFMQCYLNLIATAQNG